MGDEFPVDVKTCPFCPGSAFVPTFNNPLSRKSLSMLNLLVKELGLDPI